MAEMMRCKKCGCVIKVKRLKHHRKVCVSVRWTHETHLQKKKEMQKVT